MVLVLLSWGTHSQQVGIWWCSGGHLVAFMWEFDGINLRWGTHSQQVGIWWYTLYRWGKHGAYFRKWATPLGPHQNTTLAPATANEQKPAWLQCVSPPGPNVAAQLEST